MALLVPVVENNILQSKLDTFETKRPTPKKKVI